MVHTFSKECLPLVRCSSTLFARIAPMPRSVMRSLNDPVLRRLSTLCSTEACLKDKHASYPCSKVMTLSRLLNSKAGSCFFEAFLGREDTFLAAACSIRRRSKASSRVCVTVSSSRLFFTQGLCIACELGRMAQIGWTLTSLVSSALKAYSVFLLRVYRFLVRCRKVELSSSSLPPLSFWRYAWLAEYFHFVYWRA